MPAKVQGKLAPAQILAGGFAVTILIGTLLLMLEAKDHHHWNFIFDSDFYHQGARGCYIDAAEYPAEDHQEVSGHCPGISSSNLFCDLVFDRHGRGALYCSTF